MTRFAATAPLSIHAGKDSSGGRAIRGAWIAVVFLLACAERIITFPIGAQRITPPAQYRMWWGIAESCTGLTKRFDDVTWYVVPGVTSFPATTAAGTENVQGYYQPVGRRIAIAQGSLGDGQLVRHEMAHALSDARGHPAKVFGRDCAGVVACEDDCVAEAHLPITADSVVLASTLPMTVSLYPSFVRAKETNGWLTVIVSLRNPSERAVVVQHRKPVVGRTVADFGVSITENGRELSSNTNLTGDQQRVIAPHGALRYAFDILLFPGGVQRDGAARVRGAFGADSSAPSVVPFAH